jgi:hypothetical protein
MSGSSAERRAAAASADTAGPASSVQKLHRTTHIFFGTSPPNTMADIYLWTSFAVRPTDPMLADTFLTIYASLVIITLTTLFLLRWVYGPLEPAPAPPAAPKPVPEDEKKSEPAEEKKPAVQPEPAAQPEPAPVAEQPLPASPIEAALEPALNDHYLTREIYFTPLKHPDRIRQIREALTAGNYSCEGERQAMELHAETLRADFWSYVTVETFGDPRRELELLEQLHAAWDLREEGEIVVAPRPPAAGIDLEAVD